MVDKIRSRKAAGSNGNQFGSSNAKCQSHQQNERPQAPRRISGYGDFNNAYDVFEGDRYHRMFTPTTPRLVELPQESSVDLQQLQEAQNEAETTDTDDDDHSLRDEHSDSSEDWEEVPRALTEGEAGALTTRGTSPTPSYDFPGTWPAAAKETAAALTQVASATKSYASAIASSGLGKASWSIGTAALSSTNKLAHSFAGWGMAKTSVLPSDLPAPLKKWMLSKEEKVRRSKALEEKKRNTKLIQGETVEGNFEDGKGSFVLSMHGTTSQGEFVGSVPKSVIASTKKGSGWEEQGLGVRGNVEESFEEEDGLIRVFEFDD